MIIESFITFMNKIMLFSSYVDNVSHFPKPLSPEEEKIQIEKFRNGDEEAKRILISHNLRLVAHIVKKYSNSTKDADDLISCEYLEKLYTAAKTENADMAKCSIADFDLTIDNRWEACNITKRTIEFEPGIAVSFHNSPCAGIVRRDFLDRFHIRFSEGEQMEDSPYGILVNLLANHVAIVDETLYYHRVYHSGSTMTKVHEGEKNPNIPYRGMREAAEMLKKVFSSPPKSDIAEYMCINTLASFLTIMYMNYGKKVRYPLCEYCSAYVDDYFPDVVHNPYIFGKKTRINTFFHISPPHRTLEIGLYPSKVWHFRS